MRKKLSINDLHIGVSRVAGATPQTAFSLRLALIGKVRDLMLAHTDKDLIINGDLFDAFDIPMGDALAFYEIACDWLDESERRWVQENIQREVGGTLSLPRGDLPELVLGRGNHDISKDSSRLSMFDFIATILKGRYPDRVKVVTEPTVLWPGFYMIPHCTNQEIFNLELKRAEDLGVPSWIFIHANYNNHFAVEQDHSLNVSEEQAQALVDKGHFLIFGHEHQERRFPGIFITGNQFPTSVADCLGNERKVATVIDGCVDARATATADGIEMSIGPEAALTLITTWEADGSFVRVDWRDLGDDEILGQFIRVEGDCNAAEAASMVQAVSKLRQKSSAYVVTNSVKVEGISTESIDLVAEEMTGVDVLNYLFKHLNEAQVTVVKKLLAERE